MTSFFWHQPQLTWPPEMSEMNGIDFRCPYQATAPLWLLSQDKGDSLRLISFWVQNGQLWKRADGWSSLSSRDSTDGYSHKQVTTVFLPRVRWLSEKHSYCLGHLSSEIPRASAAGVCRGIWLGIDSKDCFMFLAKKSSEIPSSCVYAERFYIEKVV